MHLARAVLDLVCECENAGDSAIRARYKRCAKQFLKNQVRDGRLRKACASEFRRTALRSTCGRPQGTVTCCRVHRRGHKSCRIASWEGACRAPGSGRAAVGNGTTCFEACDVNCQADFDCDDGDPCTDDFCDADFGCANIDNGSCNPPDPDPPGEGDHGGPEACTGDRSDTWAMTDEEVEAIDLINRERGRRGESALRICRALGVSSQKHSNFMRNRDVFTHNGPGGEAWWIKLCDGGYTPACGIQTFLSETIIAGSPVPSEIVSGWMGSSGHRAILLSSDYTVIGIGRACGGNATYENYWTAQFGGVWDESCE